MTSKGLYIENAPVPVSNVGGALVQFLSSEVPFPEKTLDIILGELPSGVFVPLHSHAGPEWFFLLSGEMEVYEGTEIGGEWRSVRVGELLVISGSVRHAWRNRSNSPARVLSFGGSDIFAVMRMVAVPADKAHLGAPPTAAFLLELQTVAAKTGNWIATPEENAAIGLTF